MHIPDWAILAGLPLFRNTDPGSIIDLLPRFSCQDLAAGEVLLQRGQINSTLFVLLTGRVRVHLESAPDTPIVDLGAGETIGEISILDGQPVSALVIAAEPSQLLAIDQQTLWTLVEHSGAVARNLLHLLSGRLRRNNELIAAAYRQSRDLEDKALRDPLTHLLNRRGLKTALDQQVRQCRADHRSFSLLVIDVDNFKGLNDRHGHASGDRFLAALAHSIRGNLRPDDLAARYGGDELVVGLANADLDQAHIVAERIRSACRRIQISDDRGAPIPTPTLSIGLSQLASDQDAAGLFQHADEALYRAKSEGRNRVAA
jgi:diguanylate cyclase (GGDEF)-like protein